MKRQIQGGELGLENLGLSRLGGWSDDAENLLIIKSTELAAQYLKNFETHSKHSEEYKGRE